MARELAPRPPAWLALATLASARFTRSANRSGPALSLGLASGPPAESLDWRNVDGISFASAIRQEHGPRLCGSCWVFAALSSLSDRVRILQGPLSRQVDLSPQVVLNCNLDGGCNDGGDPVAVHRFAHEHGVPEETCQPYEGEGHDTGRSCEATDVCRRCDPVHGCSAVPSFKKYFVSDYGSMNGTEAMLRELQRGPISCLIGVTPKFQNWTGNGIFEDDAGNIVSKNMSGEAVDWEHEVSIVGYGAEDGKDYWVARNSWGTWWGDHGWFRIVRGRDAVRIESDCVWALPRDDGRAELFSVAGAGAPARAPRRGERGPRPRLVREGRRPALPGARHQHFRGLRLLGLRRGPGWRRRRRRALGLAERRQDRVVRERRLPAHAPPPSLPACRPERNDWASVGGERVRTARPRERPAEGGAPEAWDWRNASGVRFATWDVNELAPAYCASCWAQAVSSALSDRISIQSAGRWPQVELSPQVLLNCAGAGNCSGGSPAGAYAYAHRKGLTDQTCQSYSARDLDCDALAECMTCASPYNDELQPFPGTCVPVPSPTELGNPFRYHVFEYGSVRGLVPMMAEIFQRGPISCGVHATPGFQRYAQGVYSESVAAVRLTHEVVLAGWGSSAQGGAFWSGRNSWGTHWGEDGWFRITRNPARNLGIDLDCSWGVPSSTNVVIYV